MLRRNWFVAIAVTALVCTGNLSVAAEEYPSRPVRVMVPAGAGGPTDLIGRMLAQSLAEQLKSPFIVENRGGAGGDIGVDAVAKSKADGHSLLVSHSTPFVFNKLIFGQQPFDPVQDFVPLVEMASTPVILMVRKDLPVSSLAELIKLAKEKPGALNFASAGTGLLPHIAIEMLKRQAGVDVVHVPYKSAPAAMLAVASGEADAVFDTPAQLSFVKSGRVKAIAVSSLSRSSLMPDLPTMREEGLREFEIIAWYGFFAPAGTPKSVVARLVAATQVMLRRAETRATLATMGFEPGSRVSEAFGNYVASENTRWAKIISGLNLK